MSTWRQYTIALDAREAWCAALHGIPHGFAHTWESCRAMALTTGYPTFLYCYEEGDGRIVCPIAERRWGDTVDIVTPYGYSGFFGTAHCSRFQSAWEEFVRERGYVCGYFSLNPALQNERFFEQSEVRSQNDVYLLDLRQSEAQLWAAMSEKRRKELRDWPQNEANIITDRSLLRDFFLEHYREFFRSRHATQAYCSFSRATIEALFALDEVLVAGLGEGGRPQSVFLFTYTRYAAEGMFNISVGEGRKHTAALTWYGIRRLQALGVPVLNLGGGVRPGDGMAEFKRRFGAHAAPLQGARQVYRPKVYAELCRAAGVEAGAGNYFPEYRAPGARTARAQA